MQDKNYKELDQLIIKAKENDIQAKEEIINRYIKYIYKQAFKIKINSYELDDIISYLILTLLNCIKSFNTSKSNNFTAYLTNSINNNLMYLSKKESKLSYDYDDNDKIIRNIKNNYNIDNELITSLEIQKLNEAMKILTIEEYQLIYDIYYKKKSIRNIAKDMNISYATVFNKRKTILKKLLHELK